MMNKRGIAPLVATVLLIAFSVALGAVVMSWGETYIEEKAEFVQQSGQHEVASAGCGIVQWGFIEVSGLPEVCRSADGIVAFFDNGPAQGLAGVKARLVGSAGVHEVENVLAAPLDRASSQKVTVPVPAAIGELRQVRFTPVVVEQRLRDFCTAKALVIESLPSC